jgi:hypothetical protein
VATITKTLDQTVLSHQSLATGADVIGTLDVSTGLSASFWFWMGRTSGTAFTPVGVQFRIEASPASSGDTEWSVLGGMSFETALGSSVANTTVSGTEAAGQTVITLTSATNFVAGDLIYFQNSTIGNSEWHRILSVSGSDITLEEAIVNAQTGASVYDQAEYFNTGVIDCSSLRRLRVVCVNRTGQTVHVKSKAIIAASIG